MKTFIFFLLTVAPALAVTDCGSSHRFGQSLVKLGDSERRVRQVAGTPDASYQLQNRLGAAAGIRLDYYLRSMTVQITIQGGSITRICRIRD